MARQVERRRVDLRVEPTLAGAIEHHRQKLRAAVQRPVTTTEAARDLLRAAFSAMDEEDRQNPTDGAAPEGYASGYAEGSRVAFRALVTCLGAVKRALDGGAEPERIVAAIERATARGSAH